MNDDAPARLTHALKTNRGCFGVASWLLLVAGTFFLWAVLRHEVRLALYGRVTDGVVTKVTTTTSYGSTSRRAGETEASYRSRSAPSISYHLTVNYTPGEGEPVEFTTTSTFGHELKEGDELKVIYLPSQPLRAEIHSPRQLWLPMAVGLTVSGLCLGGGWLLRRGLQAANRAPER